MSVQGERNNKLLMATIRYRVEVSREDKWFPSVKYPKLYSGREIKRVIPLPSVYRLAEVTLEPADSEGVSEEYTYNTPVLPVLRTTRARADNPAPETTGRLRQAAAVAAATPRSRRSTPWVIQRRMRGSCRYPRTNLVGYSTRAEAYSNARPMRDDRRYVFRVIYIARWRNPENPPGVAERRPVQAYELYIFEYFSENYWLRSCAPMVRTEAEAIAACRDRNLPGMDLNSEYRYISVIREQFRT